MNKTDLDVRHTGWLFILFFLLTACGTLEHQPSSTNQKFLATWNAQLEQYRQNFIAKDTKIRAEEAKGFGVDLTQVSDPWNVIVSRVFAVSEMVRNGYVIAGRGETIKAFIAHMQTDPTPGLSDIWFLRQAEDVQKEARFVDGRTEAFFAGFEGKLRQGPEWVLDIEELAKAQGLVAGKIDELQSLHQQAFSYYQDVYRAKAEAQALAEQRERTAQTLMAVGSYLGQLDYQQQLINTLNRPRSCTLFGKTMTCQ